MMLWNIIAVCSENCTRCINTHTLCEQAVGTSDVLACGACSCCNYISFISWWLCTVWPY